MPKGSRGQIAVLMSTAISPSLVKIGLKTKKIYQYAKFWQDPFLNCGDSSADMDRTQVGKGISEGKKYQRILTSKFVIGMFM